MQVQVPAPFAAAFPSWCTPDCDNYDKRYRINGIIFHTGGSAHGGHYTACVRARSNQLQDGLPLWMNFDDDYIKPVAQRSLEQRMHPLTLSSSNAYMLFYERV